MSEDSDAVKKFRDITGVDENRAKFYLEASKNDVEGALLNFFEDNTEDTDVIEIPNSGQTNQTTNRQDGASASAIPESKPKSASRFQTVTNLTHDSSSSEEEDGQAFYAGGSVHSGQQVLGPPRSRNLIVDDVFRSVKEHGGEVVNQEARSSTHHTMTFAGTGYRLGQTESDTQVVSDERSAAAGTREVVITLRMWKEGFTVNDGPLREYSDPNNMAFLKVVSRGIIPDELTREAKGHEVHLNMEDHSHEEYVATKPKLKAFTGKGNVLGSVVPETIVTPVNVSASPMSDLQKAQEAVGLDNSAPTTAVQIRLTDGSRLVGTFNHSHTVQQIRDFIVNARPELASHSFRLLTTFPSNELTDGSQTISAAKLLNAAILLRLS